MGNQSHISLKVLYLWQEAIGSLPVVQPCHLIDRIIGEINGGTAKVVL